jgi:hypothetical protein
MKKIVRLTESDLVRLVKRVIEEQSSSNGKKAIDSIKAAMVGPGTSERGVLNGVFLIQNQNDYNDALAIVKKEGYNTIMQFISTDMSYSNQDAVGKLKAVAGVYDNPTLDKMSNHLKQYNRNEVIYDKK